jgi:hypothetical protein
MLPAISNLHGILEWRTPGLRDRALCARMNLECG